MRPLVWTWFFGMVTAGCPAARPAADPSTKLIDDYVTAVRGLMKEGQPTSGKCAGAKVAAQGVAPSTPRRAELLALCALEAPLASAQAALARAQRHVDAGTSAAVDCAEVQLSLEDLAPERARPEVVALRALAEPTCPLVRPAAP